MLDVGNAPARGSSRRENHGRPAVRLNGGEIAYRGAAVISIVPEFQRGAESGDVDRGTVLARALNNDRFIDANGLAARTPGK